MGGGRGPAVVSPEVHPDRMVTLRILAPLAKPVTVSGEITGTKPPAALTADASGVSSVTLGPLEPEIYSYGFNVDGMTVNDQRTSYVKPSSSYTSQVEVPGDGPQFYDARPVPHGDLRIVTYEAKTLDGRTRRMCVYTPPDYDAGKAAPAAGGRANAAVGQDDAFTKELLCLQQLQRRHVDSILNFERF